MSPVCVWAGVAWLVGAGAARGAGAPQVDPGWNSPEAVALVEQAISRRRVVTRDPDLRDYRAHATGHVYFLFDLGAGTTRHVVKADQVALDLYWRLPGLTRQVIVGHREATFFPTDIHYHIDHLTIVMDNLGDRVRVGEGNEVREVLHPAAPGALDFYDYRLGDSLTLRLPDGEVRVVSLEVRPKDPARPGIVGTLYLDRPGADIVRMDVTFTAASYIDRQLQYIRIVLENALWQRRYWLPWRQGLELRRELRWLDFPAGGVIRAEFRIGAYEFNAGWPGDLLVRPEVSTLPPEERRGYPFEPDLLAGLTGDELHVEQDLRAVEARAVELAQRHVLEGLRGRPRLFAAGSSSILRYRRAEGLYSGLGASLDFGGFRGSASAGRAWHANRWEAEARFEIRPGPWRVWGEAYGRRVEDAAPRPAAPGAIQTLGNVFWGEDYAEPYYASGVSAEAGLLWRGAEWRVFATVEEQESAWLAAPETFAERFRPVRAARAGSVWGGGLRGERVMPIGLGPVSGFAWELSVSAFTGDFDYTRVFGRATRGWSWPGSGFALTAVLQGGAAFGGDVPPQALFPVGGRGTARGYEFHRFAGNYYAAASVELSAPLRSPWLRWHAFGDAAWADSDEDAAEALRLWSTAERAGPTRGVRPSVGLGLGVIYDVLRFQGARGLRDGTWEWIVTVHPALWPWL